MSESKNSPQGSGFEIAVIGMAGRFPGAPSVDEFWRNLCAGRESITFFSDSDLLAAGVEPDLLANPDYVKAGGVLEGVELFDAPFFGVTPREAELMNPQHRLFLECAWEALENAGYDAEQYDGLIGVFAGVSRNNYLLSHLRGNGTEAVRNLAALFGNEPDFLTTRVSYKLNLRGPSVDVQTSCSTSLVAVHLACQSLIAGECDISLAGGASVGVPQTAGYYYQKEGIYSPDGHCRAFDARAEGTVGGNGVAIVVLKRLADALADGDSIAAVIKGSATNNDGSLKVGYTAPSVDGQAQVIKRALAIAEVDPETVTCVEAHGTGTLLGDPIEVAGLTQAFRVGTDKKGFCALGSVKTNIGHLDAAAGVTGLIKTVLALKHGRLPPSLLFERPNPGIDFANSPFYVNTTLREWRAGSTPRRAGVSSFGIGGTNAHVVLEEAPPPPLPGESRPWHLLVLSAQTDTALEKTTANLVEHLRKEPDLDPADVAYTLQVGRRRLGHRRMLVYQDLPDAVTALEELDPARVATQVQEARERTVAFMFPGQGAQHVNMGLGLYETQPVFREHVDRSSALLESHLGFDLRDALYPGEESEAATQRLSQTLVAQPALFVVEYALAQLWMTWGVRPQVMLGHSVGEYVAACLAGVFTLEEGLALVAARGRLMQQAPAGTMLAVSLPAAEVERQLDERVSLAAVNEPGLCVVSGPTEAIEGLERRLASDGIVAQRLRTSHAFHSEMMDPILAPFAELVGTMELRPPRIPYVSNLTGTWITAAEATDGAYWARHLRQTVRFAAGVQELVQEGRVLLEVGPGRTLSRFATRTARGSAVCSSMRHPSDRGSDVALLLTTMGRLWLMGVQPDWTGFHAKEPRRRLPLPTYPFQRERYWIEPETPQESGATLRGPSSGRRADVADWFSVPSWSRSVPPAPPESGGAGEASSWLVFVDSCGLASCMVEHLRERGQAAVTVAAGEDWAERDRAYTIDPRRPEHYEALIETLEARYGLPDRVVHAWGVGPRGHSPGGPEGLEEAQALGLHSLLFLLRALGSRAATDPLAISVIVSDVHDVTGSEALRPERATVLGPCKAAPHEYPHITCRSIDVEVPESGGWDEDTISHLLAEAASSSPDLTVAYRGRHRWVQRFEPVRLDLPEGRPRRLRKGGVYLITGGLGGVGLEIADYLARTVGAKLILIGRSPMPSRDEWQRCLAGGDGDEDVRRRIRKVLALEDKGAEVLVASADVASHQQLKSVIDQSLERFGAIHGVVHAAGVSGGGVIQRQTKESVAQVMAPKVTGTLVLDALLGDAGLDFVVLCSSLLSIHGFPGRVEYSAANAFLDAFARRSRPRKGKGTFIVSVNWDSWREVGMGIIYERSRGTELEGGRLQEGMLSTEGIEAFARILDGQLPQVAVSLYDIDSSLAERDQALKANEPEREEGTSTTSTPKHSRPSLPTPYVAPRTDVERTLAEIWGRSLGIGGIGIHDSFFDLGGDSVLGLQIVAWAGQAGLRLTPKQIFEHHTIEQLAAVAVATRTIAAEQAPVTGPVPLTPIQRWFFEQGFSEPHHFNLPVMLAVPPGLDCARLTSAWDRLLEHHDALRLGYLPGGAPVRQLLAAPGRPIPLERLDLTGVSAEEQAAAIEAHAIQAQGSLTLTEEPLMRMVFFDLGPERPGRLLVVAHHLLVDLVSWRILLEDLATAYEQLGRGEPVRLRPKTTSFKQWAEALYEHAQSDAARAEVDYWQSLPCNDVCPLPVEFPGGVNTAASARTVSTSLPAEETRILLGEVPRAYSARVDELLLTALAQAFAPQTRGRPLLVHLEGHGREEIREGLDLSRTVGWFTALFPCLLTVEGTGHATDALKAVKERLRRIPNRGVGYGVLRYLSEDPEIVSRMRALPTPEVSFLYAGQLDTSLSAPAPFTLVHEPSGPADSPRAQRSHVLDVLAMVVDGRLCVEWTYSSELYGTQTVHDLAHRFMDVLNEFIAERHGQEARAYTPSDFPGAKLSQRALDDFVARVSQSGGKQSA